jgi:uncharacterized membrane protein YphA (DoxX/SURF4 family)
VLPLWRAQVREHPGGGMTQAEQPRRRESAFALVKRLIGGSVQLAKLEIQHGRQEIGESLGELRSGIIFLGVAATLALLTLIMLISIVMAVLVVIGLWWVALIVLALFVVLVAFLAWRGIGKLRSVSFTPEETIASVKEDIAWAKRLLRRE